MKPILILASLAIAVLNGLLLLPAAASLTTILSGLAILLALVIVVLAVTMNTSKPPEAPSVASVVVPTFGKISAEAEIITVLGLFQEKGRFVDFLMEDVTAYDDAQVGSVARVVHQGCRDVLQEHFKVSPITSTTEGSQITLPVGYTADHFRLIGKIGGEAPFTGTLIHKGWKVDSVKLPHVAKQDESHLPVIAPAEVELR